MSAEDKAKLKRQVQEALHNSATDSNNVTEQVDDEQDQYRDQKDKFIQQLQTEFAYTKNKIFEQRHLHFKIKKTTEVSF